MTIRARVEHVALWVQDLERMREFYVERLGGQSGALYQNPRTGFTSYFVSFGDGCRIELMHGPAVQPRPAERAVGFAHVALSLGGRQAVDAAVEALQQKGVAIASHPRQTGDGYYEAVILDPEGNRIELAE